ncbi:Mediator of RNA polymerase II transcription subunit 14 [Aphelenchoides bicaudatus]|nr:Mediator of RNA polymerase II transcription subunit 14 [Aphelenchoides bicaudatus]
MIGLLTDRQNALDGSISTNVDNNNQNEEVQTEKFTLPLAPADYGSRSIALSYLLDFAIQFTYHEFSILTELLQKKSESDRKISLAHFARSTRLIFLKLFAVVKWAKKSKRFEQLDDISYFLDQHSGYFVESADRFVQISRSELIFSGLPLYQVARATDVLSKGTYINLPQAIKKRHIQEQPLGKYQHALTLRCLNAAIQYRLTQEAARLPSGISKIEIYSGMAIFTVDNEFILKMTIFPPSQDKPDAEFVHIDDWGWTILDLEILVADYEIGFGSSLVHESQKHPLIGLCMSQISKSQNDIANVYKILHEFCVKLQLDVVFCQANHLSSTVSHSYVKVDKYDPKKSILSVSYWSGQSNKHSYSIKILRNRTNFCAGLKLYHYPFNSDLPSLNERGSNFYHIFNETVRVRCQEHMQKVQKIFGSEIPSTSKICQVQTEHQLKLELLPSSDLSADETLIISISAFSGKVKCYLKALEDDLSNFEKLEALLNDDFYPDSTALKQCLQTLQIQLLTMRFCESINKNKLKRIDLQQFPTTDDSSSLSDKTFCLQLVLEPRIYLLVSFDLDTAYDAQFQLTKFDFNGRTIKVTQIDVFDLFNHIDSKNPEFVFERTQIQHVLNFVTDTTVLERIKSELEHHKVETEMQESEWASEKLIKLKSFSSILEKDPETTFDDFVECFVRQTSDLWYLECTTKSSIPLTYSNKCILNNRIQPIKSWNTLKGYSRLHNMFKDFVVAYENHFKQECTITHSAYNKLCISYGEARNNTIIILYKPKTKNFLLTFIPTNQLGIDENKSHHSALWNPHNMLNVSLNEWFNTDQDLVLLVQYLLDTPMICLPIYNFCNQRFRSLKAYSQMIGVDEKSFPVELQMLTHAISPTQIRVVCGIIHLEFYLLSGNRVILDSCVVANMRKHTLESVPLFYEFWHIHSKGSVVVAQKATTVSSLAVPSAIKQEAFDSPLTPYSNSQGVSTPTPVNQKASPMPQRPTSASAFSQQGTPPKQESTANLTLQSLLLDANSLKSAMLCKTNQNYCSPFDEYLRTINYFVSVGSSLTCMAQNKKRIFPLSNIRYGNDFVEMNAVAGVYVPDEQFVQIFERYVETRVIPQQNEIEMLSFVTACRVMADGVFQSIAQIMELEMTSKENESNSNVLQPFWKPIFLLSVLTATSPTEKFNLQAPNRRFIAGFMINDSCKQLLITLLIRTTPTKRGQRPLVKRVELVYNLPANTMSTRNVITGQRASDTEKKAVEAIMIEANSTTSNECRILPAIRSMLENFRP